MIDRIPNIDPKKGLEGVLIAQLAMAGLFMVSEVVENSPSLRQQRNCRPDQYRRATSDGNTGSIDQTQW